MEELLKNHRQEKKDLQAKIQKMKQLVPKNDKKKRKELNQQIQDLENDLLKKHKEEIDELNKTLPPDVEEKLDELELDDNTNIRISKAQRRKEKKEKEEIEREKRILDGEKQNENSNKKKEEETLKEIFEKNNLEIFEIPPDGDCMYKALEHQLILNGINDYDVNSLRKLTADRFRSHRENYFYFLVSQETGELMTDEEFEKYCNDIENTKAWGSFIELDVISQTLKVTIHIYQAASKLIDITHNDPVIKNPLLLSFHEYAYQLGNHYNSLVKKK